MSDSGCLLPPRRDPRSSRYRSPIRVPQTVPWQSPEPSESGEPDALLNLWRAVAERKWISLALSLVGVLIGFLATLPQPIIYNARASMELQLFNESLFGMNQVDPQAGSYSPTESNIRTQMQMLKSSALRKRVLSILERETIPTPPPTPAGRFQALRRWALREIYGIGSEDPLVSMRQGLAMADATLEVLNPPQTRILDVYSSSTHPELAAKFLNTLLSEFVDQALASRLKGIQRTSEWMRSQVEELRVRLERSEARLQGYVRDHKGAVPAAGGLDYQPTVSLEQMEQNLNTAKAERAEKHALYVLATSGPLEEFALTPEGSPVRPLYARLLDLRKQAAELAEKYTPAHYKMQKMEADIADVQSAIQREREVLAKRLKRDFEDAERREKMQSGSYQRESKALFTRNDQLTEYSTLKRQVDSDRQVYHAILQNINQAGLASAIPANNLRIVDAAEASLQPADSRKWVVNMSLGAITGLLMAVSWSVLRLKLNRRLHNPGEAATLLQAPELGVIPSNPGPSAHRFFPRPTWTQWTPKEVNGDLTVELVSRSQKSSWLAESFRNTRASLIGPFQNGTEPRVFVITSPGPREGKSTVACNLAITLAEANRQVVLVDADLRSPRLHTIFEMSNDWGLSSLIMDQTPVAQYSPEILCQPTGVPGVSVLPSGPVPANVGGIFYSNRLQELIERLRGEYDHVILDVPPVLLFDDAMVLGRLSDGAVLVLRCGQTDQGSAVAARRRLNEDGIPLLGLILNDWRARSKEARAGYYYGYHYDSKQK